MTLDVSIVFAMKFTESSSDFRYAVVENKRLTERSPVFHVSPSSQVKGSRIYEPPWRFQTKRRWASLEKTNRLLSPSTRDWCTIFLLLWQYLTHSWQVKFPKIRRF